MRIFILIFLLTNFNSEIRAGKPYDLKIVLINVESNQKISGCEVQLTDENGNFKKELSNSFGVVFFQDLTEKSYTVSIKSNNPLIEDKKTEFFASKDKMQDLTLYHYPTPLFEKVLIAKEDSIYGNEKDGIYLSSNKDKPVLCDSLTSKEASFRDSIQDLFKFISREIRYPQESIENGEQGKVYVSFIVEKNGDISHVRVFRGVSQAIDYEAKRVIRAMPKWKPATCNEEPSRTLIKLPINFTLH